MPTVESMPAHIGKATALKSGKINEAINHQNFSLNKTFVFASKKVDEKKEGVKRILFH